MNHGLLHNATLILPDQVCPGNLIWQDGVIKEIQRNFQLTDCSLPDTAVWDMCGDLVAPGFIDTHVHGAGGWDVMDASPESLQGLAEALLREGVTAFLPTTMSCPPEQLQEVLHNIALFPQSSYRGAEILGLHLEGPFLAKEFHGAQAAEFLWPQSTPSAKARGIEYFSTLLHRFPGLIKILTFAPERPEGQELTDLCLTHGVIPSAGHTAADFAQMEQAIKWGVRHITHAFNAMPGIHHRNPGLLTKALLDDTVTLEIIADGIHIHPAVLELILKNTAPERICLISDGTRAVGLPEGTYDLGGQQIFVLNGAARLANGTIAGSASSLRQGVRILVQELRRPLPEAVRYATLNPARLLGIAHRSGSLETNKEATFIRLSPAFELKQVWVHGQLRFEI